MNLLPFEPLENVTNPVGIRIGVQEMTRVGMKEAEMKEIARFFKNCLIDGNYVGRDVREFRKSYQEVLYSYDNVPKKESSKKNKKPEMIEVAEN